MLSKTFKRERMAVIDADVIAQMKSDRSVVISILRAPSTASLLRNVQSQDEQKPHLSRFVPPPTRLLITTPESIDPSPPT
jgi:hypothetical protein